MTQKENVNKGKMTVAEFEKRIPANAELKRIRIEKGRVCFAMGYDKDEKLAIYWNCKGNAYVRPITTRSSDWSNCFKSDETKCFNGWLYSRFIKFDLVNGHTEK